MPKHPETYSFLLDHEYPRVRKWALGEINSSELGGAEKIVLLHAREIKAWVAHNEAHRKTTGGKAPANLKPELPYLSFIDQLSLLKQAKGDRC